MWAECHVPRLQSGQNPSRQTSRWTDFKEDRTTRGQNPELTEAKVDTILGGQNFMWPDSQVDGIQIDLTHKDRPHVDRTTRRQNPERTEPIVDTILRGQNVMCPDSKVDKIQVDKPPGGLTSKKTEPHVGRIQS